MSQTPAKIAYVFRVRMTTKDDIKIAYVPLEKFMVGSAGGNAVVIKDKTIESQHLAVSIVDNQIFLTDQGSACGTRVNGRSVAANTPFQYCPGDKITVGDSDSFLQIHLFIQVHDADLEPARAVQEAQIRGREVGDEMIRRAQEEIKLRAEEWTQSSRERILAVAQQDAKAIVEKAEREARAHLAACHEEVIKQKKMATIDSEQLMENSREQIKEMAIEAERKIQATEGIAEQKIARMIREAREAAESILKGAQAAALEIKGQAHEQGQRLLNECKQHDEAKRKFTKEQCETEMSEAREELLGLRREVEEEVTEILKRAGSQALLAREDARVEGERVLTEMQEQARAMGEAARNEAQLIIAQARSQALEIERIAQDQAHKRSHEAFQSVVTEAESKALASIKERELKSQRLHEQCVQESAAMLDQARTEAARILQEGKLNAVNERQAHVGRILAEANSAAEKIREQARADSKQIMETAHAHDLQLRAKLEHEMSALYQESHRKAELIVEAGNNEAAAALEAARAESHTLKEQAHQRAQEIVGEAKDLVAKIEENAREIAAKEAEDQKARNANELYKMREQTQEAYRLAKVHEAEKRAEIERELTNKKIEMEGELRKRRTAEINRIDLHWTAKRAQDINILMRNFELSWGKLNVPGNKESGLGVIRAVVEQSFGERPEPPAPVKTSWVQPPGWFKQNSEKTIMFAMTAVIIGALSLVFADRTDQSAKPVTAANATAARFPASNEASMINSLDVPSAKLTERLDAPASGGPAATPPDSAPGSDAAAVRQ